MSYRWCISTRDGQFRFSIEADHLIRSGVTDTKNCKLVTQLIVSWLHLLADNPVLCVGQSKPRSVFRKFYTELVTNPIRDTIIRYSNLFDTLLKYPTIYGEGSSTGPFLPEFKDTPVFFEYLHWWKTGDPETLKFILSFCRFGKRLQYDDEDLNAIALRDWHEVENKLSSQVLDMDIIQHLRKIVQYIVRPLNVPIPFVGRHGPGYTADGERGLVGKSNSLRYHPRLDKAFFTNVSFGIRSDEVAHDPNCVLPDTEKWVSARTSPSERSSDVSRLKFVPKSVKTSRSICMEPVSFMYFQQCYRWELQAKMDSGVLGPYVTLRDQTRNQELSRIGSYSGDLDTIDLSAASDSVSVELVRKIFPRRDLYKLLATRTSKVQLPNDDIVEVNKFAPMGSALCFPVQCIIFSSVVILAYMRHAMSSTEIDLCLSSFGAFRRFMRSLPHGYSEVKYSTGYKTFSVYGDDIICDSRVTDDVITLLETLSFKVNTEKSFRASSAFRESCGKYYWNGFDVTPHVFQIKPSRSTWDPQSVVSLIAAANNSGDSGYVNLRKTYIHVLKWDRIKGIKVPYGAPNPIKFTFDPKDQMAVWSKNPHNSHLRSRGAGVDNLEKNPEKLPTNIRLQRDEVRTLVLVRDQSRRPLSYELDAFEKQRHILWWRAAALRGVDNDDFDHRPLGADSVGTRLKWGWTSTQ